jgi:hypothetical protein
MRSRSSVDETKQKRLLKRKLESGYYESPEEQISLAIRYNDIDLFETCFKQLSLRSGIERLIIEACEYGRLTMVMKFFDYIDINPDAGNIDVSKVVQAAVFPAECSTERQDLINYLIKDKGCMIGKPFLHAALIGNVQGICRAIEQNPAVLSECDRDARNALMYAVAGNQGSVIDLLWETEIKKNGREDTHWVHHNNLLEVAAFMGFEDVFFQLLSLGVPCDQYTFSQVLRHNQLKIAKRLIEKRSDLLESLESISYSLEVTKFLLSLRQYSKEIYDKSLVNAVVADDPEVTILLLTKCPISQKAKNEALAKAIDADRRYCNMLACVDTSMNQKVLISILLNAGAEINLSVRLKKANDEHPLPADWIFEVFSEHFSDPRCPLSKYTNESTKPRIKALFYLVKFALIKLKNVKEFGLKQLRELGENPDAKAFLDLISRQDSKGNFLEDQLDQLRLLLNEARDSGLISEEEHQTIFESYLNPFIKNILDEVEAGFRPKKENEPITLTDLIPLVDNTLNILRKYSKEQSLFDLMYWMLEHKYDGDKSIHYNMLVKYFGLSGFFNSEFMKMISDIDDPGTANNILIILSVLKELFDSGDIVFDTRHLDNCHWASSRPILTKIGGQLFIQGESIATIIVKIRRAHKNTLIKGDALEGIVQKISGMLLPIKALAVTQDIVRGNQEEVANNNNPDAFNFSGLPVGIKLLIIEFLDLNNIVRARGVSKAWCGFYKNINRSVLAKKFLAMFDSDTNNKPLKKIPSYQLGTFIGDFVQHEHFKASFFLRLKKMEAEIMSHLGGFSGPSGYNMTYEELKNFIQQYYGILSHFHRLTASCLLGSNGIKSRAETYAPFYVLEQHLKEGVGDFELEMVNSLINNKMIDLPSLVFEDDQLYFCVSVDKENEDITELEKISLDEFCRDVICQVAGTEATSFLELVHKYIDDINSTLNDDNRICMPNICYIKGK